MSTAIATGASSPLDLWAENPHARSIALALVASVVLHALAIALLPGLRPAAPEREILLTVELAAPPEAESTPQPPAPAAVIPTPAPPPPKQAQVQAPLPPREEPRQEQILRSLPEEKPELRIEPAPRLEPQPPPQARVAPEERPVPAPPPPPAAAPQQQAPPQVQAQPAAPAPTQPLVDRDEVGRAYREQLHDAVERNKRPYPRLAQMRRWEGSVEVRVQVGADGKIANVSVARSSGFEVLDERALDMVKTAAAEVDVPHGLHGTPLAVIVPVRFRLQGG